MLFLLYVIVFLSLFFRFYSSFCFCEDWIYKIKTKDYFVSNGYLFNRRIGAYSGSESWGVLPNHFYQLKAPINILCTLCRNILLHNLHYKSFVYLGVSTHPLVFVQSSVKGNPCLIIHRNDSENSLW